ncbi:MAG TPA: hypothetical protein VNQ79_29245 [Blastocatellia bacterium]|nr:hypothetical protein [Blastocatellia bacterium]
MKIKASRLADTVHRTQATISFADDDGQKQSQEITILFRGMSPRVSRDLLAAQIGDTDRVEMARFLAAAVRELPEVVDEDERPVPVTFEFFDAMEIANLTAIFNAVQEGYNPNA